MSKTIIIEASILNGERLSCPIPVHFPCSGFSVLGMQSRQFVDQEECATKIVALYVNASGNEYGIVGHTPDSFMKEVTDKCGKVCSRCRGRHRGGNCNILIYTVPVMINGRCIEITL
jgi:hypothetical protein